MDKRKQIIELIKEDSWYNIPVENTVDKIFSILGVVRRSEQLCRTFLSDGTTSSATKCRFCGKEKWEH